MPPWEHLLVMIASWIQLRLTGITVICKFTLYSGIRCLPLTMLLAQMSKSASPTLSSSLAEKNLQDVYSTYKFTRIYWNTLKYSKCISRSAKHPNVLITSKVWAEPFYDTNAIHFRCYGVQAKNLKRLLECKACNPWMRKPKRPDWVKLVQTSSFLYSVISYFKDINQDGSIQNANNVWPWIPVELHFVVQASALTGLPLGRCGLYDLINQHYTPFCLCIYFCNISDRFCLAKWESLFWPWREVVKFSRL